MLQNFKSNYQIFQSFEEFYSITNGSDHFVYSEESSQVCSVGRDNDESEEPPDGTNNPGAGSLGIESRSLTEESSSDEPEAVVDAELVLHHIIVHHTWVGIVPFIRRKPAIIYFYLFSFTKAILKTLVHFVVS